MERARMKVLIVDDEPLARQTITLLLRDESDITVAGECSGVDAPAMIEKMKPDLVFLDVQMPELDGFEVLEAIGRESIPAVVFVTAYDEYALKAFEVHAVDYLLKPYAPERLAEALARARQRIARRAPLPVAELAAAARPPGSFVERILVRDGPKVHVIPLDKLDFVEAQDDYVSFRSEGRAYLKQQTLAQIETGLDPRRFVRVHRSYILNLERLARLEPYAK